MPEPDATTIPKRTPAYYREMAKMWRKMASEATSEEDRQRRQKVADDWEAAANAG